MRLELRGNPNYCASIVAIENVIPLEGCDNICGTVIQGCHVIISKEVKVGDIGIFFPVETSIKEIFLKANNLYRDKELNVDKDKAGFFELNGRVRCMKLRGFKSEGFWIPMYSLAYLPFIRDNFDNYVASASLTVGIDFDHIDDQMICEKYIVKTKQVQTPGNKKDKANRRLQRFNKMLDNQFRFHIDTSMLSKNIHMINPEDYIQISDKIHGSSFISSDILCKRKLSIKDKIVKWIGIKIVEQEYDNIYSSRKVIKNQYLYPEKLSHFYSEDIWKTVNEELKQFIEEGMTIYGEVCGYLKEGGAIQKSYDYGCKPNQHVNYIYRITTTSPSGKVFEWSAKQIQQWCKSKGLKAVPELYYGKAKDLFKDLDIENHWHENFLDRLQKEFLEKKCTICKNDVWAEGIVLRKEILDIEVYKLKSFNFRLQESKNLDSGEENIEDNQEVLE